MDLVQWNVHGFYSRFPDKQALIWYQDPNVICLQKTPLHPSHTLNLCGYLADHYDHLDSDRANGGTATVVKDFIIYTSLNRHSPLQAIHCYLFKPATSCIYFMQYIFAFWSTHSSSRPDQHNISVAPTINFSWRLQHEEHSLWDGPY